MYHLGVGSVVKSGRACRYRGKIRTTTPGRVGMCQKWKAVKADIPIVKQ